MLHLGDILLTEVEMQTSHAPSSSELFDATRTEQEQAQRLSESLTHALESDRGFTVTIEVSGERAVEVEPQLAILLRQIVAAIGRGEKVGIHTVQPEVTTTVAAKMLGMSRPTLMKLIASGDLRSHKVGSHTRLRSDEVLAFRRKQLAEQKQALEDLLNMEADLD
jgi:excisionase family DNA binding protein